MSKISIELDTADKTLVAKLDGKVLEDVHCVQIYQKPMPYDVDEDDDEYEDEYCIEITTCTYDKEEEVRHVHRICAKDTFVGEKLKISNKSFTLPDLPGFVCEEINELSLSELIEKSRK